MVMVLKEACRLGDVGERKFGWLDRRRTKLCKIGTLNASVADRDLCLPDLPQTLATIPAERKRFVKIISRVPFSILLLASLIDRGTRLLLFCLRLHRFAEASASSPFVSWRGITSHRPGRRVHKAKI